MGKDKRRDLRSYRTKAARFKERCRRMKAPCYLCHEPIDYDLHPSDRMAFSADHVDPIGAGGHILGTLLPAHRSCNSRRNKGDKERDMPTTRRW